MSIVLAFLASLLVLSVVPGSSAQQSGPLDEDIEDYIITGVEPACPFSNSVAACEWTSGCSSQACNNKCVVHPKPSYGIDLPKIVDEQLLNTYACPTFSALVRAWTQARQGRKLQGDDLVPVEVIAALKEALKKTNGVSPVNGALGHKQYKHLSRDAPEEQANLKHKHDRHLSQASNQPFGFACPTNQQIDDSSDQLAALLEVASVIEDDGGISGDEEPYVQDYAAPFLTVPLRHFSGPLADTASLKAFIKNNCMTEDVTGLLVPDLYPFVDMQTLKSGGGGADGTTGGALLDYDYDYDYYFQPSPSGGASRRLEQAPPPPPSTPGLPATIKVCRDNSGMAEAANTFNSAKEQICNDEYDSSWPMSWCLSEEATLGSPIVAQSSAPLVPECFKLQAEFTGISSDDVDALITAYGFLSEQCGLQKSKGVCDSAAFAEELKDLKSAWQAVGAEAPVVQDADVGIDAPGDGEPATLSADEATTASIGKRDAAAAGLLSRGTGTDDDSAADSAHPVLLSACFAFMLLAALHM